MDVFHAHAYSCFADAYARRHIHGLSHKFLAGHGFSSEVKLIDHFRQWLSNKNVVGIYANDPVKEIATFNMSIENLPLHPWAERIFQPYHQTAIVYKDSFIPILDKRCCSQAHSAYTRYRMKRLSPTEIAKRDHGFHCSLYDAYELYLFYISS